MANVTNLNPEETKIQNLLGRYLNARSTAEQALNTGADHLGDDTLSAFVEGALSEREVRPVLSHLVDCTFCRHMTTELVRLDLAFTETEEVRQPVTESEPSSISAVLNGILSRIFGTADGAVFAHNEADGDNKDDEKKDEGAEKNDDAKKDSRVDN
jgi:hypothetical protein